MSIKKRLKYLSGIYFLYFIAFLSLFHVSKFQPILFLNGLLELICLIAVIILMIRNMKDCIVSRSFKLIDFTFLIVYLISIWLIVYMLFMWVIANIYYL